MDCRIALLCAVVLVTGCGESKDKSTDPEGTGASKSATIGAAGGEISFESVTLTVPAGALGADQEITITSLTGDGPDGAKLFSPRYEFKPTGLDFTAGATVKMTFVGDAAHAALLWSETGVEYEEVDTDVTGQTITGTVTHFSQGFVADRRVVFAGFGEPDAGQTNTCGPAFENSLWTCAQTQCKAEFEECFGTTASSGTFQGGCADYGACICDCEADDATCTCMNDTNCTSCELESGLQDCLTEKCVN